MMETVRGNSDGICQSVKVPVTQYPWSDFLQAVQNHNFQLESLILAQNERWRQA